MGLIYVTVSGVANIMFKNMGMTNAEAAFWSSWFVFPYVIKPLWAPALEIYKTKRFFVLLMQTLLVGGVLAIALTLKVPGHRLDADPGAARPRRAARRHAGHRQRRRLRDDARPQGAGALHGCPEHVLERRADPGQRRPGDAERLAVPPLSTAPQQVSVGDVADPGRSRRLVRDHWAQSWMVIFFIIAGLMALLLALPHEAAAHGLEGARTRPRASATP